MTRLAVYISKRYLFSKKSNNIINIISLISGVGVTIGTAAIICILSVFNGFEGLITNMYSAMDPDLKIEVVEGKTINESSPLLKAIQGIDEISVYCETFEENVLIKFKEKRVSARIKGVDPSFEQLATIDSIMIDGNFILSDKDVYFGVLGIGVANSLGAASNSLEPLFVYAPRRSVTASQALSNPMLAFNNTALSVGGVFSVKQPEYDDQYLIVDKAKAQKLFDSQGLITGIELKMKDPSEIEHVKEKIKTMLGTGFEVLNRREQQRDFYKMIMIEKWMSYLLLSFILLIATFNIIGSLSMLIFDKKNDIAVLRNMGAEYKTIRQIFLLEGWSISVIGTLIGIILGASLCLLQQHFGFVRLAGSGAAFLIDAYPIHLKLFDILITGLTVIVIGFFAAYYPVRYIFKNYIV